MKYDIGKAASSAMQTFGKGTEWSKCACLQPSQTPKKVHEPPVPRCFSPTLAHKWGRGIFVFRLHWEVFLRHHGQRGGASAPFN